MTPSDTLHKRKKKKDPMEVMRRSREEDDPRVFGPFGERNGTLGAIGRTKRGNRQLHVEHSQSSAGSRLSLEVGCDGSEAKGSGHG